MLKKVCESTKSPHLAFEPRQVTLAKQSMAKNKLSSETLENGTTTNIIKPKQKKKCRDSSRKALFLHSIATFLDRSGFSKTLTAFQSEAVIEVDGWKEHSLDLEDMYYKYLETSKHHVETDINAKEIDLPKDAITRDDEEKLKCDVSVEPSSKKMRKKNSESDVDIVIEQPKIGNGFTKCADDSGDKLLNAELHMKSKEKRKKNKLVSDSLGALQVSLETFKESSDELDQKFKVKKKKKSKLTSESLAENVECGHSEILPEVTKEKSKDLVTSRAESKSDSAGVLSDEPNMKLKDKKKKKKVISESLAENIEHAGSGNLQEVAKRKSKDLERSRGGDSMENTSLEIPLDEKNVKSKDKKRKKDRSTSQTEEIDRVDSEKFDSSKKDVQVLEENAVNIEKTSKKRKRLISEESKFQPDEKIASDEAKQSKAKVLEEDKGREQLPMVNASLESDEHAGKRRKTENDQGDSNKSEGISVGNQLDGHANGNLGKNEKEGSAIKKTMKKEHNGSAEPKTVNAFQRVKIDEVEFADERLQDNSYWGKDGADTGYGAKAQEVLGQVRGRDFRHEKTKKKRGSYRGGQIDFQTHSVKFNYSDDDE